MSMCMRGILIFELSIRGILMDLSNNEKAAVGIPRILLPRDRKSLKKWCVIACDQYTSDESYWQMVEKEVGGAPSALRMILPEVYLSKPEGEKIQSEIAGNMKEYLNNGIFEELPPGFVLVKRSFNENKPPRCGLVLSLDLERYDFSPDSKSLIRATEGTIKDRIPPRLKIRSGAPLELSHTLVLIDDPGKTVIEPLYEKTSEKLYSSELGFNMGYIEGWFVSETDRVIKALNALLDSKKGDSPMLYAMGDGNHSFATAWAYWQQVKQTLSENQLKNHPARFALCEVVNIHDPGIEFEPIHRVVFSAGKAGIDIMIDGLNSLGRQAYKSKTPQRGVQNIKYRTSDDEGYICVARPKFSVEAGTADEAIAFIQNANSDAKVDYIHGEKEALSMAVNNNITLLLPVIKKDELFPIVEKHGPLPRKAFSMGEADEKRCYLEARRITEYH